MGVPKPNYTMIPNVLLDEMMPDMSEAELKVSIAICRKTFGWQKERDRISLSQLQRLTGMSRQGVLNGLDQAMTRGLVVREPAGEQGFIYELVVTSQPSGLVPVNEIDQLFPKVVNEVDTQKKVTKETKENAAPAPRISDFTGLPIVDKPREKYDPSRLKEVVDGAMFGKVGDLYVDYPEDVKEWVKRFSNNWKIAAPAKQDSKGFAFWIKSAREIRKLADKFGLEILDEYYREFINVAPYTVNSPASIITSLRGFIGKKMAGGGVSVPGTWIGLE